MDDHADHAVLGAGAVRAIGLGSSTVETNHGVLHADPLRVHRDGHGIGVIDGELAVGFERLGHRLGAVLLPERVALLGVVAHGQRRLVAHLDRHGVPNELAAGRPSKVTHILGVENPGLFPCLFCLLVLTCFLFGDNEHRLIVFLFRLLVTATLGGSEHRFGVAEGTCGRHNVVFRHGQFHVVVPEVQGELTAAKELLVLPSFVVAVHHHAWVELRNGVDVVVLVLEVLVSTAAAVFHAVVDVVPPIDAELELVARLQGARQIDAHHGVVDGVVQALAGSVHHFLNLESTVKRRLELLQVAEVGAAVQRRFADFVTVAVEGAHVLVQLKPHVTKLVRAVVGVRDGFRPVDALGGVVEVDLHVVVCALLPVFVPGSSGSGSVDVGRGQLLSELLEHVGVHPLRGFLLGPSAGPDQAAECCDNPNSHGRSV